MSMWKTIPTLFGDLADRPDAADVPYGTQFFAEDTEELFGSDESVWHPLAASGGGALDVEDDGTPVASGVDTLNFGPGLDATDDGGGQVTIDRPATRRQADLPSGSTFVDVAHGAPSTPERGEVQVTPASSLGSASEFWLSTFGASTFRINVDTAPGQTVSFDWRWAPAAEGPEPPFAPDDLSGLELWLDATAITGLSDTDPVALWDDLSGNSRDAAEANAALQPVYRTGIQNGLPVVRFASRRLVGPAFSFDGLSLFMVLARTGTGGSDAGVVTFGPTGGNDWNSVNGLVGLARRASDSNFCMTRSVGTNPLTGTGTAVGWLSSGTFGIWESRFGGGSAGLRVDGGTETVDTYDEMSTVAPDSYVIATRWLSGAPSANYMPVDVAEIVAYSVDHSSADRTKVREYLAAKWGITL